MFEWVVVLERRDVCGCSDGAARDFVLGVGYSLGNPQLFIGVVNLDMMDHNTFALFYNWSRDGAIQVKDFGVSHQDTCEIAFQEVRPEGTTVQGVTWSAL